MKTTNGRISDFSNMEFENDLVMESWMTAPFATDALTIEC